MTMSDTFLCRLDELPEGTSRGFSVKSAGGFADIFVVHKHNQVFAYQNSCPHTGGPLDWLPDRFLNLDGDLIQCATHDALFRIEDGACVAGPCNGRGLTPLPLALRDGEVYLVGSGGQ